MCIRDSVLGFSVLSGIQPFGAGSTIMDLEDFIVSSNLLPLGSLVYLLFCVTRYGSVSYTHLDVYKRQPQGQLFLGKSFGAP